MQKPKNLGQLMELYSQFIKEHNSTSKANQIIQQLKTAIYRYLLPAYGFSPLKNNKITQVELKAAEAFCYTLKIEQLYNALNKQAEIFANLKVSKSIQYPNKSRLKDFLDTAKQQNWLPQKKPSTLKLNDRCPGKRQKGFGGIENTPLMPPRNLAGLKPYSLKEKDFSPKLAQQMKEFYKYRTQKNYSNRFDEPVSKETAQHQMTDIAIVLGYHHHYGNIPKEDLDFETLVPYLPVKKADDSELARRQLEDLADDVDNWLCDFLSFLEDERQIKSPHTKLHYVMAVLMVAKFLYRRDTIFNDYRDLVLIDKIKMRLSLINKEFQTHQPVADISKRWLDLNDLLTKVVEPLRLECQPKLNSGWRRSDEAVGQSIQRYVILGLLTYMPPRRIGVFAKLKMATSCPVERPAHVPPDGLFHPLPPLFERHQNSEYPYLYQDHGKWYLDLTPQSYKTGKTYGHQKIEIANPIFEDDRSFYEYLEMWLYGYYLSSDGSPRNCGTNCNLDKISRWYQTRMIYQPEHNFVFTQYNGMPTTNKSLSKYVSTAVHSTIGKRLNPHLIRDIYATYFLEQNYSDEVIRSLAYAMGHSVEMLRKIYDLRHPHQKRISIEKAVAQVVQQTINGDVNVDFDSLSPKAKILHLIPHLTAKEREEIQLSL